MKSIISISLLVIFVILITGFSTIVTANRLKVLVVMSYEKPEVNSWCREIKEGIDSVLGATCDIDYFYMNTKIDFKGGNQKAIEAYSMYQKKKYDGVIAADDYAQQLFVVQFLKSLVETPVMFCGVNAEAKKYGYPASNVSGILERGHFRESIALIKQLSPDINKIGFVVRKSPSGEALKLQIEKESGLYLSQVVTFELVETINDIKTRSKLKECDAFFIDSLEGILNEKGKPIGTKDIIQFLTRVFGKPVVGANNMHVESGALCAVVKSGQEQGKGAAKKLLEAMNGKAIVNIPITKNYRGKRVINVDVMRSLGIKPEPIYLLGSKLITSAEQE